MSSPRTVAATAVSKSRERDRERVIELLPTQRAVLVDHRHVEVLAHVGGVGSGKTHEIGLLAMEQALTYRGNYGAIAAATYPQLWRSTIRKVLEVFATYLGRGGFTFNLQRKEITIPRTRSQIAFISCDVPAVELQGPEFGFLACDEGEGIGEEQFNALYGRVRRPGTPQLTRVCANPPHRGHWIERRFLTEAVEGWKLIRSSTYENRRVLGESYIRRMEALYPPGTIRHRRYLMGEMGLAMEGAVYPEWSPARHIISEADWLGLVNEGRIVGLFNGLDLGFGHPTCFLGLALDDQDRAIVFGEHHAGGMSITEHAEAIRGLYLGGPIYSDWQRQDRHEYELAGVDTVPAPKEIGVEAGLEVVRDRLRTDRLLVVAGAAPVLCEQMTTYRWARPSREGIAFRDAPIKVNDDAQDALRYALTGLDRSTETMDASLHEVFARAGA